jgi:geranylgeranyl pyrophosphate synthase
MRLFAETLSTIVNGEITQMFSSQEITCRDDYYERIYAKTASMFVLATTAAAVLSPVDEDVIEALRTFGYEIGMAFQVVDDVLDFTGEQATVGKPVASDLRQGLITLPTIIYMESHPDDPDVGYLKDGSYYNETRLNRLIPAIRESGAIEEALYAARQFVDRGLEALAELALPLTAERQALEDLASYIVSRHR